MQYNNQSKYYNKILLLPSMFFIITMFGVLIIIEKLSQLINSHQIILSHHTQINMSVVFRYHLLVLRTSLHPEVNALIHLLRFQWDKWLEKLPLFLLYLIRMQQQQKYILQAAVKCSRKLFWDNFPPSARASQIQLWI